MLTVIPNILLAILFITAIAIVALVLLQNKGGNVGAAFGGGSNTVFGARGAGDFLSRTTSILAAVFFFSALGLAAFYNSNSPQKRNNSVINSVSLEQTDAQSEQTSEQSNLENQTNDPVIPE